MTDREQYALGPASGAQFRRFWSAHVDALERHLDRTDQPTPTKRRLKKRPRGPNRERDQSE
jgi:hypothetical protein